MAAKIKNYFTNISDRDVILILLSFFAGAVTVSLVSHFLSQNINGWVWADSFFQNFGTEMFGAFLTFLLIEVLVSGRRVRESEKRERHELRERLMRQLGSKVNGEAIRAAEELRASASLTDGSLQNANLNGANLQQVKLLQADLRGARMSYANLQGANLGGAILREVDFSQANLQGVRLREYLFGEAEFDEFTMLPNGTQWTPDTDLARFTNPDHPEFWRSNDPQSPAYRGDDDGD